MAGCLDCWAALLTREAGPDSPASPYLRREDFHAGPAEKKPSDVPAAAKLRRVLSAIGVAVCPGWLRSGAVGRADPFGRPWWPIRGTVVSASELAALLPRRTKAERSPSPSPSRRTTTTLGDKILPGLPIAIPKVMLPNPSVDISTWAVIAGDKYTADEEYWKRADAFYGDKPSAKSLIFPEVFLSCNGGGTPETDQERMDAIWTAAGSYLEAGIFDDQPAAFMALERDTPFANDRRGLVLAVDLEHYSFERGSSPLIRPTEKTIPERLPDRIAIRQQAVLELPHIVMFIDDGDCSVIEPLFEDPDFLDYAYTAELYGDAGQVRGSRVTKPGEDHVVDALREFVAARDVLLMVGDGNHSIAAAKACWEQVKASAKPNDPRRYALVEVQNLHDPAVNLQPIHRVLFNVDVAGLLGELKKRWPHNPSATEREIIFVAPDGGETRLTTAGDIMSVVEVSEVLDHFMAANEEARIDFVHGEQEARDTVAKRGQKTAALILPPIAKAKLLTTLKQCGVMPQKAFSTGHAIEKRFYIEARKIRSQLPDAKAAAV